MDLGPMYGLDEGWCLNPLKKEVRWVNGLAMSSINHLLLRPWSNSMQIQMRDDDFTK